MSRVSSRSTRASCSSSPTMSSDSNAVEIVDLGVAGPSNARKRSGGRRRRAPVPRRKVQLVPPQDIIEIQDSDEDDAPKPVTSGKGKSKAVETWRDGVEGLAVPQKTPLFLPDNDPDSDEDVLAMLEAGDVSVSNVSRPHGQQSPKDKGQRTAKGPRAGHSSFEVEKHAPLKPPAPSNESLDLTMLRGTLARVAAQVLEIVPDIDQHHLAELVVLQAGLCTIYAPDDLNENSINDDRLLQAVLQALFAKQDYPKASANQRAPGGKEIPAAGPSNRSERGAAHLVEAGPSVRRMPSAPKAPSPGPVNQKDGQAPASNPPVDAPVALPHEPEQDPISRTLAQVLEIIPDVDPTHVSTLINHQLSVQRVDEDGAGASTENVYDRALQAVLHILFENPDYPKVSKKRKRVDQGDEERSGPSKARIVEEIDYGNKNRQSKGGKYYDELSMLQLCSDFPDTIYTELHVHFMSQNRLYAPTYLSLRAKHRRARLPDALPAPSNNKRRNGKGKGKAAQRLDPEFEKERAWLIRKLLNDSTIGINGMDEAEGGEFECGCCFSSYHFNKMTQCPDAHLFCTDCVTSYASTLLGEHNPAIACMDQSGCKLLFTPSELRRILSPKLLELYERVSQRKELEAAGLENLEECPFCEYQVVIENEQEKLFRCEREDCGAVSCRKCKKLDHLPKSCEEANKDKMLDARHAIEEAMTAALMRNCPKCNKGFIKEAGCNKMVCPHCHTMSCYACRQVIRGYDHFNQAPPYNQPKDPKKCQLWDSVEQRHADEVAAAARRAQEEVKRANPEVAEADLKVDLPPAPPKPVCNNPAHHHHHHHHPVQVPNGMGLAAPVRPAIEDYIGHHQPVVVVPRGRAQVAQPPPQPPVYQMARFPPLPPLPQLAPQMFMPPPPPVPEPRHHYPTRARGPLPPQEAAEQPIQAAMAARLAERLAAIREVQEIEESRRARPVRAVRARQR